MQLDYFLLKRDCTAALARGRSVFATRLVCSICLTDSRRASVGGRDRFCRTPQMWRPLGIVPIWLVITGPSVVVARVSLDVMLKYRKCLSAC